MIFILNRQEKIVATLKNGGVNTTSPFFDDVLTEDLATGAETFQFSTSSNSEIAKELVIGNYVAFMKNGKYKLFQIMQTEEIHDEFLYFNVYCECAGLELINKVFRGRHIASADLKKFLTTVLEDTGWSVGGIEATSNGAYSFDLEDDSVYATLQNNLSKFDVEMEFRIEINNGRISKKYIDTYYKRGKITGKRFEFGKDIEQITRKINSTELYTALIGKGINNISFRDVTVSGIDKPLGQDFVADQESFERYNNNGHHLIGVYYFETSSPQELLRQTYKRLKEVSTPQIEYEVKVALLGELLGEDWNKVSIGDTVYIIDNSFNPALQLAARVVKLETSFTDPEKDTCTLANFMPIKSNITDEMRKLASQLEGYVENSVSNKFPIGSDDIQDGAIGGSHLNQSIITTDHLIAGSVTADKIDTKFIKALEGEFTTIKANHGEFKNLVADKAEIIEAKIEDLKVNHGDFQELVAQKAEIFEADIIGLKAETAKIGDAVIDNAKITNAEIEKLKASHAEIDKLVTNKAEIIEAEIGSLKANDATLNNAIIKNAEITNTVIKNAEITNAKVDTLVSKTGNIENLVSGNITADNISTELLTVIKGWLQDASIGNAQISSINANKITAGEIDTSLVTVASKDGAIEITGNQILINDTTNPLKKINRIILGKVRKDNGTVDYSLLIRGKDGKTVMFDSETGITNAGITSGAIKDNVISDEANIAGYKLDINSVIREVNENGTVTISGTKVQIGNKTLNVELNEQKKILDNHGETLSTHGSKIEANEREIRLKVSEQVYGENLKTINSEIKAMKNLIELGIGEVEITEKLVELEKDIKEYTNSQIKEAKTDIKLTTDGIKQSVSSLNKTTETLTTDLSTAKSLAESKAKIFTTTPVPPYKIGDLWAIGQNGDLMKCKTARQTGNYNANDWEKATKYTDDTKVNVVEGELNATKKKVNTNESSINILKEQITSKVSQTDVEQTVANIKIGGRNLFINTGFTDGTNGFAYNLANNISVIDDNSSKSGKALKFTSTGGGIYQRYKQGAGTPFNKDEKIVISGYFKCSSTANLNVRLEGVSSSVSFKPNVPNEWTRFELPVIANGTAHTVTFYGVSGNTYTIKEIKVELGNKATDWTPAPEDTDKAIVDNIKIVNDKITQVGTELTQTKKSITASVSSLESKTSTIETNISNTTKDLTAKINTAKNEAISVSANDATNKADKALSDSKSYTNAQVKTVNDKVTSAKSDISILQGEIALKVTQTDIDNSINKIQFGGRNLIRKSNITTYKSTLVSFDEETNTYTLQVANGSDNTWGAGIALTGNNITIPYGKNYICSFEILVPVNCNWNVKQNYYPVIGTSWNGTDNDDNSKRSTSTKSLTANVWTKCWFKTVNTHNLNSSKVELKDNSNFGIINNTGKAISYKIRNIKGELATTPSDWTPAPEDANTPIMDSIEVVDRKISDLQTDFSQTKKDITARVSNNETNIHRISEGSSQNLLYNADFAIMNGSIPDGWSVDDSKLITLDKTTTLLDGIPAFYYNITGLTSDSNKAVYSPTITASKGQKFTASAYVYGLSSWSTTDKNVYIEIEYLNSSGSKISNSNSTANKTITAWQRISVTGTCPDGTVKIRMKIYPSRNGKFNMSKPMLQVGEVATGWQKGFNIQDVTTRLKNAETKITDEAITNTVKSNFYTKTETNNQITNKGYQTASDVKQTVDSLQLKFQQSGGYNLIRNSTGAGFNTNSWTTNATLGTGSNDNIGSSCRNYIYLDNGSNTSERYAYSSRFKLKPNTKYIFTGYFLNYTKCPSFDVFVLSSTSVDETDNSTSYTNTQQLINAQNTSGAWKKFVCKFTTPANVKSGYIRIDNNGYNSSGTGDNRVHFNALLLVEGEVEIPWSSHPNEIYDGITTIDKSGVTVTASNVKSRTKMSADGFRITKTDTNEDVFKVNADGTLYMKGNVNLTSGSVPTNILTGTVGKDKIHATILADINKALSDSSSAVGKIDTTNKEIEATKSKVSTLESNFTTMQGQISSKVSQSDIDRTVANIKIGGRNLVKNSDELQGLFNQNDSYKGTRTVVKNTEAKSGKHIEFKCTTAGSGFNLPLFPKTSDKINKTYTWSFWAKANVNKNGNVGHECSGQTSISLTNEWKYYSYTWKFTDSTYHSFTFYLNWKANETLYIRDFKIEEGNKPTDWTPAPEDTDKFVTDSVKVVSDKIASVSTDLTQTKKDITARVTNNETKINSIGEGSSQNLLYNADFAIMNGSIPDGWSVDTNVTFDKSNTLLDGIGSFWFNSTGLTQDKWYAAYSPMVIASKGQKFTASVYVLGYQNWNTNDRGVYIEIEYFNSSGDRISTSSKIVDKTITAWQRVVVTGTCPDNTVKLRMRVHASRNGNFNMSKPMLQVGEVATGWQKGFNIQDVTTRLKNAELKVTDSAIKATVEENFYTKKGSDDAIANAIKTAKAEIKVTTDSISTQVSKKVNSNEIVSKINQSAESVKIKANKIQLEGSTTIGDNQNRHIQIDKANYSIYRDDRKLGYFGIVDDEKDGHPKLTLGHNGIRVENDDYLTLHAYGGSGNNAEGNSSAYCDFAYHSIKYKDWSNIKMYASGGIKIAPLTNLEITTNCEDGVYKDEGERRLCLFDTSKSQYFNSNLQIPAIRNTTSGYGFIIADDHVDGKETRVRIQYDGTNRYFRPLTTAGNIALGSASYKWASIHSVAGVSYSVADSSLDVRTVKTMDSSIDTALDTLDFDMNLHRTAKESTEGIQFQLDVSNLKKHELANMFLNITEEISEDGEIMTSTSADMASLLHLALYELQKQKNEIKLLKEQIATIF